MTMTVITATIVAMYGVLLKSEEYNSNSNSNSKKKKKRATQHMSLLFFFIMATDSPTNQRIRNIAVCASVACIAVV